MSELDPMDAATAACLVLFLKAPARSKRRLAAEIGELATTAATHLWACVLEDLQNWPGPVYFAPAEAGDAAWLARQLGHSHEAVLQAGGNLGERINHVDETLRNRGEQKVLFVGTDCPAMEVGYLLQAAADLNHHDVVLGPATDGGVVLMGARRAWPALTDLPWSTHRLHGELVRCCARRGLTIANLEPRADVDSVAALLAARRDLAQDLRPARRAFSRWLSQPNTAWDRSA
ncbi:MAG: TIGR04282 family arsenosugar biosynthesis glycosyltransferase [Gammaproteobacteria bacterium]